MIWLLCGVALMTWPIFYAVRVYGGPPAEAIDKLMTNVSLAQLVVISQCVRFGGLVAGYGLMRVLT
jgi:hypothetical protein